MTMDTGGDTMAVNEQQQQQQQQERPDAQTQKRVVSDLFEKAPAVKLDQTWYLVDHKWFETWKRFAEGSQKEPPGPIDNSALFDEHGVKPFLAEGYNVHILDEETWRQLVAWYGLVHPKQEVKRKTVMREDKCVVDLAYLRVTAVLNGAEKGVVVDVSRTADFDQLHELAKQRLGIPADTTTRLRNFHLRMRGEVLSGKAKVGSASLYQKQMVCVETQADDGTWPSDAIEADSDAESATSATPVNGSGAEDDMDDDDALGPLTSPSAGAASVGSKRGALASTAPSSSSFASSSTRGIGAGAGLASLPSASSSTGYGATSHALGSPVAGQPRQGRTGLTNLGNTCFMNSALQCLSHTLPLTRYFLEGPYKEDLNPDNPIGCGGRLAMAYRELIAQLWQGSARVITPREFKFAIGRFAPQFVGYQQHDSQELTSFLLDGLHEDLNRIRDKPYVEMKEAEGEDAEAAALAWHRHKLRNDSIIVDLFHGQLKSTLVCPDCNKVSITFDPFMYLQVPLPENETKVFPVTVSFKDPNRPPKRYGVKLPKTTGTISMMCQELEKMTGVSASKFVVTDVYAGKVWKVLDFHEKTSSIRTSDSLIAHELEETPADDVVALPVYFFRKTAYNHMEKLRPPAAISIARNTTGTKLAATARALVRPYVRTSAPMAVEDDTGNSSDANRDNDADGDDDDDELDQALEMEFQKNNNKRKKKATTRKRRTTRSTGRSSSTSDDDSDDDDAENNADNDASNSAEGEHSGDGADEEESGLPSMQLMMANKYAQTTKRLAPEAKIELSSDLNDVLLIVIDDYKAVDFGDLLYPEDDASVGQGDEVTNGAVPLTQCLDYYTSKERLTHDNMWRCPVCKEPKEAEKQMEVWKLPDTLVIHLKRFSYNSWWRDKLDTLVDFPLEGLDLGPYVLDPQQHDSAVYDLYGVSNHMGGLGGGHYTAYCLDTNGRWYEFDDSYVGEIAPKNIVSTSSYFLFYQRRSELDKHALTGAPVVNPISSNKAMDATADVPNGATNNRDDGAEDDEDEEEGTSGLGGGDGYPLQEPESY
ncbi:hypothetical protein PTSG_11617 [Salpingoeca rosetta]|uniref:Uncharacterized protein n=1 Tax=Salpingoeca rosetta (strain ATCC 50818 / BSB-021) TaxID=946362 RepID=F2TWX9_SALR5|nr:uncharacterized protein PTSG_11617 [Salpingoeca rosetta]EGD75888.1 hypothetical protein PTSG_11617 [Salpingoeca rosetta]|eukprot:XP_004998064.1 hypothetical protein PTSG_11617 [Salpingoeca rosetta]